MERESMTCLRTNRSYTMEHVRRKEDEMCVLVLFFRPLHGLVPPLASGFLFTAPSSDASQSAADDAAGTRAFSAAALALPLLPLKPWPRPRPFPPAMRPRLPARPTRTASPPAER
jgi:hypothetical protein